MSDAQENLNTMMRSGRSFSSPPPWNYSRTHWTVAIIPRTSPMLVQIAILVGIPTLGITLGVVVESRLMIAIGVVVGLALWGGIRLLDAINVRRGPWFVFRLADGIVELPRLKVTVVPSERKEFQLIFDKGDSAAGTELNLIVNHAKGNIKRYGLVGGGGICTSPSRPTLIQKLATELSESTGIPIRLQQASCDGSRLLCQKCGYDLRSCETCCSECGMPFKVNFP